jgi:hypothetical protein
MLWQWATSNLYRGDLRLLSDFTRGITPALEPSHLDRLKQRHFVKIKAEKPVITVWGRAALLIKKIARVSGRS